MPFYKLIKVVVEALIQKTISLVRLNLSRLLRVARAFPNRKDPRIDSWTITQNVPFETLGFSHSSCFK
jgi:hypothetical protein